MLDLEWDSLTLELPCTLKKTIYKINMYVYSYFINEKFFTQFEQPFLFTWHSFFILNQKGPSVDNQGRAQIKIAIAFQWFI